MNHEDEQLDRAFASVTCLQVARHFGIDLKVGVQKSPFREDKNGKSFSVVPPDGRFFKDHAVEDCNGGAWKFAKLCAERSGSVMENKAVRDLLVTLNGEIPEKLTRGMVKRQVAEKRRVLYDKAEKSAFELPSLDGAGASCPGPWSDRVRERWEDGVAPLMLKAERQAEGRGWGESVICDLVDLNKTSAPELPWGRGRGWGWLVEKPVFKNGVLGLVPVGYHSRYLIFNKMGAGAMDVPEKRWIYVPYVPQCSDRLSGFQEHLIAMGTKLPAYPFILGDTAAVPRLVVILEGQFDAVSFAEAFGWLRGGFPEGVVVMGLRGVQSQKALLAGYGLWLRKYRPFVWVIGDNDAAGHQIDHKKDVNAIAGEPTFVDRIRAQGCEVYAELIGHPGCKDFNDVWMDARPSVGTMKAWAYGVGVPKGVEL